MCGIAGVIRVYEPGDGPPPPPLESIPESWLDVLDDSIKHRGPDGEGRFRDRAVRDDGAVVDVALVHRRLSIIDHDGGTQPMVNDGERLRLDLVYSRGKTPIVASEVEAEKPLVAVVFNGCVYNHRELRSELEGLGHVFGSGHSDTEVLVHGWREWRNETFQRLDAMNAQLVWDRTNALLACGRDFAGEKPLVYKHFTMHTKAFASDHRGLTMLSASKPLGDTNQPGRELARSLTQPGRISTYLNNQFEIHPGLWMTIPGSQDSDPRRSENASPKKRSITQAMLPKRGTRPRLTSEGRTDRMIQSAITSRLEADVPLGVFLSGGIDSALIAAITHQHRPNVRAFTVRMPDDRYDESKAADETARHIGIAHEILECAPDPSGDLVTLIERMGMPFGDSSLLPTYWVSKAAREHVKVALSGDGSDELFGGYRRHTIAPVLNRWHALLGAIPARLLDQRRPGSRSTYLARLATAARYSGYQELVSIFPTPDLRRLITSIEGKPIEPVRFRGEDDPLLEDFTHYLSDDLLRKTDTASMAVGLEVRAPFLARELVESALRTPLDVLMPNGERKGLLKQVARKYLPDYIVDRPKQGFAIPIGEWFRSDFGSMRQLLLDHLRSADPFPGLADAGVELNMRIVERMIREHDAAGEASINPWHGRDHSQRLYMLLVLSIWCKWLERVRQERPAAGAG